jgi:hypothetical protein
LFNLFNWLLGKLTNKFCEVPLFWVTFDLNKYNKYGAKNSCILKIHPELKNDEYIKNTLNDLVDYIRDTYDMEKLSK